MSKGVWELINKYTKHAEVAEFGRRAGLRIQWALRSWGFKSPLRHHYGEWVERAGFNEIVVDRGLY